MKYVDITRALCAATPAYAPEEAFASEWQKSMPGDICNLSRISMGVHCGTHLDAPRHFLEHGETVEHAPLELLNGPALVADLAGLGEIPKGTERLLLKNAREGLSTARAREIAAAGVRLIGIDGLSVGRPGEEAPAHVALLSAGVWILESLDLQEVEPGWHDLLCLPIKLAGLEAAPVRAALRSLR